ncbi:hypothetical protein OC683_02220 ['Crotalaria aegyptiaca' phytoplasma]|uniref:Uncharacterized protein n=1 Tax=Candidatus Phytoplasma crotalariae TaxID=2982627 RepID=A0ABT9D316_9MOLU|nr:hypothetical protein ['Crotalaria aegyptiaca' phytoplasma]MDO8059409.1 hypothetical protein ['Crotalaria aegyptiaca' phytoplasma]
MKIKSIIQNNFILGLIILIGYEFVIPHGLYALPQPQLQRCNAYKYTEKVLLLTKKLNQNVSEKIKKIMKSIHQIIHWGIDLLTISNEIIDLTEQ